MKTRSLLIILILTTAALLLVACGESTETPTPAPTAEPVSDVGEIPTQEPTEVPTEEPPSEPTSVPTEEPTEEVAETGSEITVDNVSFLQANPWQWVSFTDPLQAFDIETPVEYILAFNEDGTVEIKANCNNAGGTYVADDSSLMIEIGPMTLAACPEGSRSDQFVQLLSGAAIYFFADGKLFIDLMADDGTMAFEPAASIEASSGVDIATAESTLPEDLTAQLDAYLQWQVYSEGGDPALAVPGLVMYVETPDGRYLNAAGVTNLDDDAHMQVDDILEVGSNTKSMTIVLLMQLVEEGLLLLDDPLSQYLPDQAAILPNGDQITIRQMAQHTAGLWDYGDEIIGAGVTKPTDLEAGYTPRDIIQFAADKGEPYFAPGEESQWHYSNTGYVLLGMIIESLTGAEFSDLIQSRIFDPLGMESAVFLEGVPQDGELTTHGYYWNNDWVDTTNWNASQGWAAGAAAMTASDLATYGKALAAGELFQNPETLQEMLTFDPAATQEVAPYGLGLLDLSGDGTVWGHEGATLGFQSLWYTKPENGIVVVGLTNSGAYKAYEFYNVINILEGEGPLPVTAGTLLPIGLATTWQWEKLVTSAESTELGEAANIQLLLTPQQEILIISPDCGSAGGAYTVNGFGQISFEINASDLTCDADSPGSQLVQHLNDAVSWYFSNGRLVIELPMDGGSMIFGQPQIPTSNPGEDSTIPSWRWIAFVDPVEGEISIDKSGNYTLKLVDDLVVISTNCQAAVGSYETDGNALTLTYDIPEKSDEGCEEGSYGDRFYELLQGAAAMHIEEGLLYIDLMADGGTLVFQEKDSGN